MRPTVRAGERVNDWRLVRHVKGGPFGSVWIAEELVAPFRVGALKICCGDSVSIRKSKFRREVRFVRKKVIRKYRTVLYGWGVWNGFPYYVTELGEDAPSEWTPRMIRRIFGRVAEGIAELHEAGFLYCDPKKGNIVLVNGVAKMVDFGTVTPIRYAEKNPRATGTWELMPDEVRERRMQCPASDVAALGAAMKKVCVSAGCRRAFGPLVVEMMNPDWTKRPTMKEAARRIRRCHDWRWRWLVICGSVAAAVVAAVIVMAVVGSITVNRVLSRNGELGRGSRRKAAEYERKVGDKAHAARNAALSRGEREGR